MRHSYLILVNVNFVQPTMIVVELLNDVLDYYLYHGYDLVINELLNHVDPLMHCPDLNCPVWPVVHLLLHRDLKLVGIHVDYLMVNMIHRMRLPVFVNVVNVDVLDLHVNLVDLLCHIVLLSLVGLHRHRK